MAWTIHVASNKPVKRDELHRIASELPKELCPVHMFVTREFIGCGIEIHLPKAIKFEFEIKGYAWHLSIANKFAAHLKQQLEARGHAISLHKLEPIT